jgi:hypothetical protein
VFPLRALLSAQFLALKDLLPPLIHTSSQHLPCLLLISFPALLAS